MLNNTEHADPFGPGEAADAVRSARARRRLTALDEGQAWRRRNDAILAVARVEVFADADQRNHRATWQARAEDCLDATWRARWQERDVEPGWIEATWMRPDDRPREAFGDPEVDESVDWLVVEDHTGPDVAVYEHVTSWCGRLHHTLTVRHVLGVDLRGPIANACRSVLARALEGPPTY